MAEARYRHEKEKDLVNHSEIIRNVLKLNNWDEEIENGIYDEFENDVESGDWHLIQDDEIHKVHDDDEPKPTRKIGKQEVLFSQDDTKMIRKLFGKLLEEKINNPKESIKEDEVLNFYKKQMASLPSRSPFMSLEKYTHKQIVTKVRTIR